MGEIHLPDMYSVGRAVAPADCGDQEAAQVQGAEEEAEQVAGKGRQGEGRRPAEEEAALQVSRPKLVDLPTKTPDPKPPLWLRFDDDSYEAEDQDEEDYSDYDDEYYDRDDGWVVEGLH